MSACAYHRLHSSQYQVCVESSTISIYLALERLVLQNRKMGWNWIAPIKKNKSLFEPGPSGAGKSSLAAALAGVNPVARGQICCGKNQFRDISIAYVPQKPVVLPSLSALENICLGMIEEDREKMTSVATHALELAALGHLNIDLHSPLPPLSGFWIEIYILRWVLE